MLVYVLGGRAARFIGGMVPGALEAGARCSSKEVMVCSRPSSKT